MGRWVWTGLQISTALGSKTLFSTGSFVLKKDKILWENEI